MPLAHLNLGQGAAGDVAAPDLQFSGQLLLRQMPGLPQKPNAASHLFIIAEIHTLSHLYPKNGGPDLRMTACLDSLPGRVPNMYWMVASFRRKSARKPVHSSEKSGKRDK